jgi:hypothetical protein
MVPGGGMNITSTHRSGPRGRVQRTVIPVDCYSCPSVLRLGPCERRGFCDDCWDSAHARYDVRELGGEA